MTITNCPICLTPKAQQADTGDGSGSSVVCRRCGAFKIGWQYCIPEDVTPQQRANLSGWIRKNPNCSILHPIIRELLALPTPPVQEKAQWLQEHLAEVYSTPGQIIEVSESVSLELQAVASALDHKELLYLLRDYLCEAVRFLVTCTHHTNQKAAECFKISPEGWVYIDSLRQEKDHREIGFHVVQ